MKVKNPSFFSVDGKLCPTTWDEAFAAAQRINRFFDMLASRFPGRKELCEKMMYAMMTRHHVLMIGPHGTAKTLMIDSVLDAIQGGDVWRKQLTKEHKPTDIFGMLDIEAYRKSKVRYMTDGTLSTANFAHIGELLDANDMTLRSTLGALNERRLTLGTQLIRPPLMTVFADTNFRLEDEPARVKKLAAVWDRFLFNVNIDYLEDAAERLAMFTNAADNLYSEPVGALLMEDIVLVSGLIRAENLHGCKYVMSAYEEATRAFREGQRTRNEILVSDRRLVQAMDVMEAYALLNGRTEVTYVDVDEARLVLCGNDDQRGYFDKDLPVVIKTWEERAVNREVEAERDAIEAIINSLPVIDVDQEESETVLLDRVQEIHRIMKELVDYQPAHYVVTSDIPKQLEQMRIKLSATQMRLISLVSGTIPNEDQIDGRDVGDLIQMFKVLGTGQSILLGLLPANDKVNIEKCRVTDEITRARARIQVETFGSEAQTNGGG